MTRPEPDWRKSTFSDAAQNCVEVAPDRNTILLRNSNHPDRGHLTFAPDEMAAFIAGAKAGEFDDLTTN